MDGKTTMRKPRKNAWGGTRKCVAYWNWKDESGRKIGKIDVVAGNAAAKGVTGEAEEIGELPDLTGETEKKN